MYISIYVESILKKYNYKNLIEFAQLLYGWFIFIILTINILLSLRKDRHSKLECKISWPIFENSNFKYRF